MTTKSYNLSDFNGKLLIASPAIGDVRFQRTVIYLCSDTKIDGVTGFVINQPLRYVSFRNVLSQMKLPFGEEKYYPAIMEGGPVDENRGFVLHSSDYTGEDTLSLGHNISISTSQTVIEDLVQGKGPANALFILGCAKWLPGQLETEIAENAWLISQASSKLIFETPHHQKWEKALSDMGFLPQMLSDVQGNV